MKKTPGSINRRGLLMSAGLVSVQGLLGTSVSAGIVDAARLRKKAHDYYQPLSEKSAPASGSYFDILVIGSGYGSAIFSSRVSDELSPHSSLAILERGKEWFPGDFPETMTDYLSEIRSHENSYLDTLLRKLKVPEALSWTLKGLENQLGLLDFYEFDEFSVIAGNGLGGTSLINANIALRPDDSVFDQQWPEKMRAGALGPWFDRARRELRVAKASADSSLKLLLMQQASHSRLTGSAGFRDFHLLEQTVQLGEPRFFQEPGPVISAGYHNRLISQIPCIQCGNCLSGCNVGSKNSLNQSSLAKARSQGAKIFTQIEVDTLQQDKHEWLVHANRISDGGQRKPVLFRAKNVILGAGALGTLKILFKSKALSLSPSLGKRFHGNGDDFGFISFRNKVSPSLTGRGLKKLTWGTDSIRNVSGTAIQSVLDFRDHTSPYLIEDLTLPSLFSIITKVGLPTKPGTNTGAFLLMEKESCDGEVHMVGSGHRMNATWRFSGARTARHTLRKFVAPSMGGDMFFPDSVPGYKTTTAHPLGGVCLSDHPDVGVVNDSCQVWNCSHSEPRLYKGLYVVDGSVIPSSLIANPLLTISAVSMRAADEFIKNEQNRELFRT